uniref:MnxD n=1 Tax=Bacillus sp. MB-7 TaxID=161535 RepID=A7KBV3_9BACI|nr:MnxD [Bacillus sp. MB-7]
MLEQRKQEARKKDSINELNQQRGEGLTSPTTFTTTEETRLLMEYMDRANTLHLSQHNKKRGKLLTLRKFFKSKRNQQVEVYFTIGSELHYKEGKVSTVGRDFVMITNLRERMWIPYSVIESANIVYGIPTYSNAHQHYLYDNNLRTKLLRQFGETVSKRDNLKQQFFEETLQTNLETWKDTWVNIWFDENVKKLGKISSSEEKLTIMLLGKKEEIDFQEIKYIETIRLLSLVTSGFKHFYNNKRDAT